MTDNAAAEQAMDDAVFNQLSGGSASLGAQQDAEPTEAQAAFEFDEEFQSRLAALALRDNGFTRRTWGLFSPDAFENTGEALLVSLAQDFYEQYRQLPGDLVIWQQVLKKAIADRRIRESDKADVLSTFKGLMQTQMDNVDFAVDQVSQFAQRQAVTAAFMASVEDVEKGNLDKVKERFNKAFQIGAMSDFREVDYFEDIEQRTNIRKDKLAGLIKPDGITTGLPRLNSLLYHKGWGRRELTAIMGGAKKGKSMGLGHFAMQAALDGKNAIYFTLEVADQIIADRMDASLAGVPMDELPDKIMEIENKVSDKKKRAGKLKIIEFPTGSLSPGDIRRILEKYRAEGLIFDLIVVDYADIMRPDRVTGEPTVDNKEIWIGLRAIAGEQDAAVLTATQTNRDGFKQSTAKAEHAADDFNKIRIADLIISINRDDDERARGEARLYFAASRNQGGEYTVRVTQDMASMQFITGILGIE